MKLLKFLSTAGFVFCLFFITTTNSASAEDCAWDPEKSWQGVCSMYCTEGEELEDTAGTAANCADNPMFDVCCIPNPEHKPEDELTGYCGNDKEKGKCTSGMFGSCPESGDYSDEIEDDMNGCAITATCCGTLSGDGDPGGDPEGDPDPLTADTLIPDVGLPDPGEDGIQTILIAFLNWLLIIFLIASLIAFVLTGLMYLIAMGNSRSDFMDRAKKYFVDAIIALAITGSGLIIINVVNEFLKGEL